VIELRGSRAPPCAVRALLLLLLLLLIEAREEAVVEG
jgi:hypothetical protein